VVDEERMKPGQWLGQSFYVSFGALAVLVW